MPSSDKWYESAVNHSRALLPSGPIGVCSPHSVNGSGSRTVQKRTSRMWPLEGVFSPFSKAIHAIHAKESQVAFTGHTSHRPSLHNIILRIWWTSVCMLSTPGSLGVLQWRKYASHLADHFYNYFLTLGRVELHTHELCTWKNWILIHIFLTYSRFCSDFCPWHRLSFPFTRKINIHLMNMTKPK